MAGLEDTETAKGEESEDGAGPRVERARQVHSRSNFSRWSNCLENQSWNNANPESTESFADLFASRTSLRKIRTHLDLLDFLELVQLAKHRKWFLLAARDVAGRQCLPVVLEDSQKLLLILPKMRCV